jgi:hypothetical protein
VGVSPCGALESLITERRGTKGCYNFVFPEFSSFPGNFSVFLYTRCLRKKKTSPQLPHLSEDPNYLYTKLNGCQQATKWPNKSKYSPMDFKGKLSKYFFFSNGITYLLLVILIYSLCQSQITTNTAFYPKNQPATLYT